MDEATKSWLQGFIERYGAVAGTVHALGEDALQLRAAINIPAPVIAVTQSIPRGKGMAGLAWERNAPVSTCNLATDTTGDVRPGAKAVDAQAAVALPVHDDAGQIRAVVGIAFLGERTLDDDELRALQHDAASCP